MRWEGAPEIHPRGGCSTKLLVSGDGGAGGHSCPTSPRSSGGRSKSFHPHEAHPIPGPDLHPWPPPHLPAIAMETWMMP